MREKKKFFTFFFCIGLLIVGFLIEGIFRGEGVWIGFPYNLIFLSLQIALLLIFRQKISSWFLSKSFILISSGFTLALTIVSGLLPQNQTKETSFLHYMGLDHITSSWYFFFMFLLASSGLFLATLKRIKNPTFLLNHLGIFLIITSAYWGSFDIKRIYVTIREEELIWSGEGNKEVVHFPFAIKLQKFSMKEYSPEIVLIDSKTQKIIKQKKIHHLEEGESFLFEDVSLSVLERNDFYPEEKWGASFYGKLLLKNTKTQKEVIGEIITSSLTNGPKISPLPDKGEFSVALIEGRAKKFESKIEWFLPNGKKGEATIEVNKPFSIEGYTIYQYGYDDALGRWSRSSILEINRDPWLYLVYLGMLFTLLGTFMFIWTGRRNES